MKATVQEQFIQQHKGGFRGSLAVARVPKFAVSCIDCKMFNFVKRFMIHFLPGC